MKLIVFISFMIGCIIGSCGEKLKIDESIRDAIDEARRG